jgi:Mg-chelatase subunit ChlD
MHKSFVLTNRAVKATAYCVLGLCFAACGSSRGVEGETGGQASTNPGTSAGGTHGYQPGVGGTSGSRDAGTSGGSLPSGDANCGVQTSNTKQLPTDVLLVLDRSGSMTYSIASDCCCSNTCRSITGSARCSSTTSCTERWPALTSAVDSTITTASGINWALKLFSSPSQSDACGVNAGVEVGIASDSVASIQTNIAGVSPSGNTPTASAITAAATYLGKVADSNTKVILLATDGEPNCKSGSRDKATSDKDGTTTAITAAFDGGYKVYVIGIGPSVGNLDSFAQAGGTDHYYPATSSADLVAALATISKAVSSCNFEMSQTPPDPNNVAVYLDGVLVPKDSNNGWSFGSSEQTVILNGTLCTQITSGTATKVQVLFGCPGQPPPQVL